MLPSEYIRRNCRFSTLVTEDVGQAVAEVGDVFGFSSDFPHAEGTGDPLEDFASFTRANGTSEAGHLLYHRNAAWVLHQVA
jgi:hypothetical protein